MNGRRRGRASFAAALVALLMLAYASVQSSVMQVAMAAAAARPLNAGAGDAPMSAMTGMETTQATPALRAGFAQGHAHGGHAHAPTKSCPYCAAAAHAPLIETGALWRAPSAFSFAAFRAVASHGPRGPPARQPRARGPPTPPLRA